MKTERLKSAFGFLTAAIATVGLLATAFYGLPAWIDGRVEAKLRDPDVLREIAHEIRPSIVFNADGHVLADLGGLRYIEEIETNLDEKPLAKGTIRIRMKEFLAAEPLLSTIDPVWVIATGRRSGNIDWEYDVEIHGAAGGLTNPRFRIEFLP